MTSLIAATRRQVTDPFLEDSDSRMPVPLDSCAETVRTGYAMSAYAPAAISACWARDYGAVLGWGRPSDFIGREQEGHDGSSPVLVMGVLKAPDTLAAPGCAVGTQGCFVERSTDAADLCLTGEGRDGHAQGFRDV